ncbi:MAG TPA: hypothetical protein VIM71_11880 [Lacunisphaera sp.]
MSQPVSPPKQGQQPVLNNSCEDGNRRREWDADAAAAEAKRRFGLAAQSRGEQLGHREQTAVLYKSGSGVAVGVIGAGPIGTGSAAYDLTGIDIKDVIGIIHNHPGGTLIPSAADWTSVYDRMVRYINNAGGDGNKLLMYVIGATYPPGGPAPTWRIFVYDQRNRTEAVMGPEVNPAGEPC